MNTYVTFEQAKLLKEKGFDQNINSAWFNRVGNFLGICNIKEDGTQVTYSNTYSSAELVTREYYNECCSYKYCAPEQWQVVEWLRVNHGIWIEVTSGNMCWSLWAFSIHEKGLTFIKYCSNTHNQFYDSPQEAYSGAFDYILKELI
jgi:hypothetical protein